MGVVRSPGQLVKGERCQVDTWHISPDQEPWPHHADTAAWQLEQLCPSHMEQLWPPQIEQGRHVSSGADITEQGWGRRQWCDSGCCRCSSRERSRFNSCGRSRCNSYTVATDLTAAVAADLTAEDAADLKAAVAADSTAAVAADLTAAVAADLKAAVAADLKAAVAADLND